MGESNIHVQLVNIAYDYIEKIVPEGCNHFIQKDSPDDSRPPIIDGFIPDVFFQFGDLLVLGEAKRIDDFDRLHSKKQFEAYMNYCRHFCGKSVMVVSVPWQLVMSAKNYLRLIKNRTKQKTEVVVINESGKWWTV